jgi:hypothetical protein
MLVNSPHLRSKGLSSKNKRDYVNRRRRLEFSKWQRSQLELTEDFKKFQKRSQTQSEYCKGADVAVLLLKGVACAAKISESQPSVLDR